MKYAFYPKWYITKEEDKKRKRIKFSIIFILFLMVLMIIQLFLDIKNLITIENKLNKKLALYNIELNFKEKNENRGVQHSFNSINEFTRENDLTICSMSLSEEELFLSFQLEEKINYSNLISSIESKFKIKTISPPIEYNEIFLVIVEIEKDEDL